MNNLNIAVVGAGYWGKNLCRNFHELGVLKAICDSNLNHPHFKNFSEVQFYSDFKELLKNTDIHAVAIATPAEMHYSMAKLALNAGKHVFVEKPLCLSEEEGSELNQLAHAKLKIVMVGHLLHYHPAFLKLKELINQGELGKIQYIYSNRLNLGKFRKEENILWSFAPHDISVILSLANAMPLQVFTTGGSYLQHEVADVTLSHLSFANGIKAHIFVSWLHPYKEQKLVVVGSKAMAVFDDMALPKEKLQLFPHRINWQEGSIPVPVKEDAVSVPYDMKEPLREECLHFIQCIENNEKPRTDGEEGLRVLKILKACQRSLENNGQIVTLAENKSTYFAHSTAVIDSLAEIGVDTKVWHFSHIMKGVKIGRQCNIGQNVVIGPNVTVGNGVKIQNNVSVYEGVTLEDDVFCGPSMVFTNVFNPRSEIKRMHELRKTLVKKGATIGANATIVCGVKIGRYAFVGAGAVVTKDVPDYALVVGNPARQVGFMCRCGIKLPKGSKECKECGEVEVCN